MRLIDADKMLAELLMINERSNIFGEPFARRIKRFIDRQQTVEARKHGHWVQVSDWDKNGQAHFDCSVCGAGDVHADDAEVPYCWHCGAVMDEEV